MNDSATHLCSDDSFGPTVRFETCRDGFDFTLLFEESIFAILPAGLLLCAVPIRFWFIYRRPDAVRWSALAVVKVITIALLCLLKLSLLILWTRPLYAALRTRTTIAAAALDLVAAISIGLLSPLEHSKSQRPSALLGVFLFFTTILDVARARTEWLLPGSSIISPLFVVGLAVKGMLVILEGWSKANHMEKPDTPEQTSSIYSLSFFAWLNPLIYRGNRADLKVHDLYPIDQQISSPCIDALVQKQWESSSKDKSYSLAWAIAKALWVPITASMVPRLVLIGFSLAQPFLVEAAIDFVKSDINSDLYGYGLIGAFGCTFLGIAISTAWYQYLTTRALAMIRAALISIIYKESLDIAVSTVESSSPASLMGADVERITTRLQWVLSTAPNTIQVALAIWILETRLGPICVAPILVVVALAYGCTQIAEKIRPRQRQWMQAVQKRVTTTSDTLGSLKGMKMLGLTDMVTKIVQDMREAELSNSKRFRQVQIANITLGNAANMLSPIVTFIGYGIILKYSSNRAPTAGTIFASLSLLSVMISPVNELVSAIPNLASALECCHRIQQYVLGKKQIDFRNLGNAKKAQRTASANENLIAGSNTIEIKQVSAGWSAGNEVLQDLSVKMYAGTLTMVVGPVGCGKSTLLQVLLGEGLLNSGSVALSTDDIAYCDQTPFLTNCSIRENVLGDLDYEENWYVSCIQACALDIDVENFSNGDESLIGSKGVSLSGGQRQRLALARAVYARKSIILMDDCFSGLDLRTEHHCFYKLLGRDGLMRQTGATIILATHAVKWLPYSDQIIVLGAEGRSLQIGSFQSLISVPGYLYDINLKHNGLRNTTTVSDTVGNQKKINPPITQGEEEETAIIPNRGRGDAGNLLYYINTMGKRYFALFLLLVCIEVIFIGLQPLWLSWWIDANQARPDADLGKWLGVYALLGISAVAFLGISGGYYLISLVPGSASTLHFSLLTSVMRAPMTFLSATDSGSILNRFTQDMTLMDMQLPMSLLLSTEGLGNTIAGGILTCVSSGYMALSLPFIGVALFYLQKFYLRTSRQMRLLDLEARSPLYSHLTETLDGVRTIRAFKWKQHFLNQNFELIDLAQRPFYLLLCLQNWLKLVLDVIVACLAIILITLVVTLRNSTNSSLLGVAMVSVMNFSQTLSSFVNYWTTVETSLGAVARTRQFITETPSEPFSEQPATLAEFPLEPSIEYRGISASYRLGTPDVITNINLSIKAGERVAICGRSGSGKSTLVALLLRMLGPSSGSISIGDKDISSLAPELVRRSMNSLPQDPWFVPGGSWSVRSNLDPLKEATDAEICAILEKTGLTEQVQNMGGLDVEMRGSHLSAGQKQLFCLARAMLMRRSRILLLDEATSSVDVPTEERMMSLLRTEFHGWTIVAVVHRLSSILDFDRVVVLNQGSIIECGSPAALLSDESSAFAKLYQHIG